MRERIVDTLRKHKEIPQNALYLDSGSELFYVRPGRDYFFKTHYPFLKDAAFKKSEKTAFISMGCGNASPEKETLQNLLGQDGYEVTYFGVDSSLSILEMAREELQDIDIQKHFICADFGTTRFKQEMARLTRDYDVRVYAFFGSTIGNLDPDYLADLITDLMHPGDYLHVDGIIRPGVSAKDDRNVYEQFMHHLNTSQDFIAHPLLTFGIHPENGEFFLEMRPEKSLNSLLVAFKFRFKDKVHVEYRDNWMTFLPGSEIEIITARALNPEGLVLFFKERGFAPQKQDVKDDRGQFLFKYKD